MRSVTCTPAAAIGARTRANVLDSAGHRLLAKGRLVDAAAVALLATAGVVSIDVVFSDPGELDENTAADRLAQAVVGPGTVAQPALHGRADITAVSPGLCLIDPHALAHANARPELTLATITDGSVVSARGRVASVKIMPFAVDAGLVPAVGRPVVSVVPFIRTRVGLLVVGTPTTHGRLRTAHLPPLGERLAAYGATVTVEHTCMPDRAAIVAALTTLATAVDLVVAVADSSVKSLDDPIPAGIVAAGGTIIRHGAPVEPGNLMLLACLGRMPILAAPGCVRQRARNVIDLVLPRLVADHIPSSADIAAWAAGGLLGATDD
ncbi:MAG: hypothetical protein RLZZ297_74 [Chloroflexota bacterium]|jgi:molybdopterin biosynthesis enzyme